MKSAYDTIRRTYGNSTKRRTPGGRAAYRQIKKVARRIDAKLSQEN